MNDTKWQVADRLNKLRLERGMSQVELARISGVGFRSISTFETADQSPRVEQVDALVRAMGLTLAEFFAGIGEDTGRLVSDEGTPF